MWEYVYSFGINIWSRWSVLDDGHIRVLLGFKETLHRSTMFLLMVPNNHSNGLLYALYLVEHENFFLDCTERNPSLFMCSCKCVPVTLPMIRACRASPTAGESFDKSTEGIFMLVVKYLPT